jgi:hypothetical protein
VAKEGKRGYEGMAIRQNGGLSTEDFREDKTEN